MFFIILNLENKLYTISINNNFNHEKLLDSTNKRQQTSLKRINTFKNTKEYKYDINNPQNISKSFQTLEVKSKRPAVFLSQRALSKINSCLEQAKEMIIEKKFKDSIETLTTALVYDENH